MVSPWTRARNAAAQRYGWYVPRTAVDELGDLGTVPRERDPR